VPLSRRGKQGQQYNTVAKARAALATLHRLAGHKSPCDDTFVQMSLDGIGRTIGRRIYPMAALPVDALRLMAQAAQDLGGVEGARDRAVLLFGFCGAFRRSEFTALNKEDIELAGTKGVIAHLRKSKTDQTGLGRKVPVACDPDPNMCPVKALDAYMLVAGLDDSALAPEVPIFRSVTRGGRLSDQRMCDQAVWRVLHKWAEHCGIEGRIGAHSLRSGFVTAAAQNKKPLQSIMKKTGHRRADTVLRYIRYAELFDGDAAEGIF
jgi:integrase